MKTIEKQPRRVDEQLAAAQETLRAARAEILALTVAAGSPTLAASKRRQAAEQTVEQATAAIVALKTLLPAEAAEDARRELPFAQEKISAARSAAIAARAAHVAAEAVVRQIREDTKTTQDRLRELLTADKPASFESFRLLGHGRKADDVLVELLRAYPQLITPEDRAFLGGRLESRG